MVFGFGKVHAKLYDIRRNKKRQDQGRATSINILKECLKGKKREATKTRNTQERREYLMKNGYSQAGKDQLRGQNVNVVEILKEKTRKTKTNPICQNKKGKI